MSPKWKQAFEKQAAKERAYTERDRHEFEQDLREIRQKLQGIQADLVQTFGYMGKSAPGADESSYSGAMYRKALPAVTSAITAVKEANKRVLAIPAAKK